MIQLTPQMKILVAVEAVDGRKGIDSLARLCQEKPVPRDSVPGLRLCDSNIGGVTGGDRLEMNRAPDSRYRSANCGCVIRPQSAVVVGFIG